MAWREVSAEDVVLTIRSPDQVLGQSDRKIAQRRIVSNGKPQLLRVVFEEDDSQITVVTFYLTSKIRKYWR